VTKFRANLSAWSGYQKNGKNSNGQLVIEDSGDILVKNIWRSDALGNVNDIVDRRLDGKKVFLRNRFGDEIILNMNRHDAETFYRLISVDQLAISTGASQMNISPEEKSRIDEGERTLLEPQDKVKREKPQEETKKAQARENRSDSAHRLEPPPTPACPSCGKDKGSHEEAKEQQGSCTDIPQKSVKSPRPIDTQKEIAKVAAELYPNPLPNIKPDAITDRKSSGPLSGAKVKRSTAEVGFGLSWNLENPRAVAWMKAHGAELLQGIDETTRLQIRSILTQATEEGWSYTRTAGAIAARFPEFGVETPGFKNIRNRAELVATTEAHIAYAEGNAQAAQSMVDMGVQMEKRWVSMHNEQVCEDCAANEAQGWIDFGDNFQSGHAHTPGHPGCSCYDAEQVKGLSESDAERAKGMSDHQQEGNLKAPSIAQGSGYALLSIAEDRMKTIESSGARLEQYGEILSMLETALARGISPFTQAIVHRHIGEIQHRLGRDADAIQHLETAISLNPKFGVKRLLDSLRKESPTGPS
jgi:hypothetical protein